MAIFFNCKGITWSRNWSYPRLSKNGVLVCLCCFCVLKVGSKSYSKSDGYAYSHIFKKFSTYSRELKESLGKGEKQAK